MSISSNDIMPIDRDAVVAPNASIRLEAPNNVCYSVFCDREYPWLVPVAENVQRMLWYERNWDSHGALPVNQTAVQEAFSILSHIMADEYPAPRLSATPSGGIQMEWRVPNVILQIEIGCDGSVSAYFSDSRAEAGEWEEESVEDFSILQDKLVTLKAAA